MNDTGSLAPAQVGPHHVAEAENVLGDGLRRGSYRYDVHTEGAGEVKKCLKIAD